jgi:Putative zinc-finger
MNCRTARTLLPYLKPPGELPAEDADALTHHLANCADCRALVESDAAFDRAVGRAMADVTVPEGLSERIHVRLAQENARVWQRNLLRVSAAAALLLAALFGGLAVFNSRVPITPEEFVSLEDRLFVNKLNFDANSVVEYFRSQRGLRTDVPRDLDYSLLLSLEVVDWKGKQVARLDFQRDQARAKVLVLPKRDFRIGKDVATILEGSSCSVEMSDGPGDFLFVFIFFNGANRQMF